MTEANVTGYTVIYSRVSGSSKGQDGEMRSVFPAAATSDVIDGLESEATYVFQVLVSAVVEGKEVVGDRSAVTLNALLITKGITLLLLYMYNYISFSILHSSYLIKTNCVYSTKYIPFYITDLAVSFN